MIKDFNELSELLNQSPLSWAETGKENKTGEIEEKGEEKTKKIDETSGGEKEESDDDREEEGKSEDEEEDGEEHIIEFKPTWQGYEYSTCC